jgi:hypothetical protein
MKKALKIKLAVVLYIIYWWLTLTELPLESIQHYINYGNDLNLFYLLFMLLIFSAPVTYRVVNFIVDLSVRIPLSIEGAEYYSNEKHIFVGVSASSLFWAPTLLNFELKLRLEGKSLDDTIFWIGLCKFLVVAFLFYCIDELLVEVLKKRLPKANS